MNIHSCKTTCAVFRPDIIINEFQSVEGDHKKTVLNASCRFDSDVLIINFYVRLDSEKIEIGLN